MRQKDSIDNLINQYSQPPVQNIINTGTDFEARILKENEQVENILINKRTMFLDETNKKLYVKEVDGSISKEYEIIIPLDEKDKKILDLETKLKEMESRINEYSKSTITNTKQSKSISNDNGNNDTTTATNG
jgi:hypothetical protein